MGLFLERKGACTGGKKGKKKETVGSQIHW
jgi:hypothetical protein